MKSLPRLLLITSRHQMQPSFEAALEAALRGGARLVQLREKDMAPRGVLRLAQQAQPLCASYGAELLVNSRADIAAAVSAGVHLPEHDIPPAAARAVLATGALCGVSVHSVEAAQKAAEEGADYLVFGSVFPTASHPGEAPQGVELLQRVTNAVECPVYAIGGISKANIVSCLRSRAHGVAVISAVWSTPDIAASVQNLRQMLGDF